MILRLAPEELAPAWAADLGAAVYRAGGRLVHPPAERLERPRSLRVTDTRPVPPRYALALGKAVLEGRGWVRRRAPLPPARVTFQSRYTVEPGAISRGLALLARGVCAPYVAPGGRQRCVYLTEGDRDRLAALGSNRAAWLRAAAWLGARSGR